MTTILKIVYLNSSVPPSYFIFPPSIFHLLIYYIFYLIHAGILCLHPLEYELYNGTDFSLVCSLFIPESRAGSQSLIVKT